jgi:putative inorganic carbon (HCO3(-)) transporter
MLTDNGESRPRLIARLCRAVVAYEWAFLFAILPLLLFPSPARSPLLLLIPLLWLLRKLGYAAFVPATPLDWPIFLLLLALLVSLYATFDLAFSFPKIAGVLMGVALFYATVATAGRSVRHLWLGVGLLIACGWGIVAFGLLAGRWITKLPLLRMMVARLPQRLLTLPGAEQGINPNEIAGALLWVVPLALLLFFAGLSKLGRLRRQLRWWQLGPVALIVTVSALVLSGTLLLTQSRSGLLGFGVALIFMVMVIALGGKRRWLLLLVVVGVVALVIFSIAQGENATGYLFEQANFDDAAGALNSLDGRLEIWSRALYGIQDFPITGLGMNNFRRVVHILYPLFLISPDQDVAHAHNNLLQPALDLGLPGLIAYLAIYFGAAAMAYRVWRGSDLFWHRTLALGIGSCLLAYFVYGLTDTVALGAKPGFLFWLLLGLAAALHRRVFASPA